MMSVRQQTQDGLFSHSVLRHVLPRPFGVRAAASSCLAMTCLLNSCSMRSARFAVLGVDGNQIMNIHS